MNFRRKFAALALLSVGPLAASENIPDQYPASALYSKTVEVIPPSFPPSAPPARQLAKTPATTTTCRSSSLARARW